MRSVFNIAPRVVVYPHGSPRPPVEEGWLALAQFDSWPPGSAAGATAHSLALRMAFGSSGPSDSGLAPEQGGSIVAPERHAVFGDGSHPTTRLCAGAVDLLCRQRPGLAMLDVGTGTGILARIAAARGASHVVGTDIDPAALACARAHAELDGVASLQCHAPEPADSSAAADLRATGAAIHFGSEAPDHWGARFDLVVANILEAPLHALAPALCRALKPGGMLLISGFTRPQAPALRLAYETAGLQSAGDFTLADWVLQKFQSFSR